MSDSPARLGAAWHVVLWAARLSALLAIAPLMLIVFGERGSGPSGAREWIYLALFPFGFSAGYLLGWRWPTLGGSVSLACLAASLAVIDRTFDWKAYATWGVLSIPAALYLIAGWKLRRLNAQRGAFRSPTKGRDAGQ